MSGHSSGDIARYQNTSIGLLGVPYNCKNCGEEGRMITTCNRPQCPSCGRRMRYVDAGTDRREP